MPITYDDPGTLYDDIDITYDGPFVGGGTGVTSVLQIVDPDNPTTVLYDLNDQTGVNSQLYGNVSTYLITDMDLGVPALRSTGTSDIAKPLAFNRQATAPMRVRLRIKPASNDYDDLLLAVTTLANHLADGCVMRWQPTGAGSVRYIDVLASPTPVLVNGGEFNLYEVLQLVDTPQGITLNLERLAYLRGDKLTPSVNLLSNSTPGRDSNNDGTPDSWTILSTPTLTLDATKNSQHVVAGAASRGSFQDTGAATVASGNVVTAAADFLVTSGTAAITLDWRTGAGATISTVSQTTTATRFTRVYVTGTAPATTDHVRVTIQSSGGASTFDWRYAQCEVALGPTPYRVAAQTLSTDPAAASFAQIMPVYNPADAPSPCELVLAFPTAGSFITEVDFGLVSDRNVPGTRSLYSYMNNGQFSQCETGTGGWSVTLYTETTSTADALASGGNTALVTPASNASALVPTRRFSLTRNSGLAGLRGRWKVYIRAFGGGQVEYNLQLTWGMGAVAGNSNDPITHDCTNTTAAVNQYVYLDLGDIDIPREQNIAYSDLTLDVYSWQTSGALATLKLDNLILVPTDDAAFATVPGGQSITVKGKALTSPPAQIAGDPTWHAGAPKSGAMRLNNDTANQAAGFGLNAGYAGTANIRHQAVFDYSWNTQGSGAITVKVGIADVTLPAQHEFTLALTGSGADTTIYSLDDTAGRNYDPRLGISAFAPASGHVDVNQITLTSIPYIAQNGRMRTDPGSMPTRSAVEQLSSTGQATLPMDCDDVPFWLPPGLSLIYINVFELPVAGYDEQKANNGRTFTVTPTVYPRYWG